MTATRRTGPVAPTQSRPPLLAALLRPEAYPHPVTQLELLETHGSWVILTGPFAYKLKKPVNFGFLDFSTPERRHHCCLEELRLNGRLAPELYRAVVPIHGPIELASLVGPGPVIEHAVQLRQFDQGQLLGAVLARGELEVSALDRLADDLVAFQARAAVAPTEGPWGTPAAVREPVLANLTVLERQGERWGDLRPLRAWLATEETALTPLLERRLAQGCIREGHGDLHLGNLLLENGRITVFDCIEFSAALRWIDPISDLAFLVMDLGVAGHPDLGQRLLNRWLEQSGDAEGLVLWRWYSVYRALVRAKVAALGLEQNPSGDRRRELEQQGQRYLALARTLTLKPAPGLLLMHGFSGCGKSHLATLLGQGLGAVVLRSDQERKRWFGLWGIPARAQRQGDPYGTAVSRELFERHLPERAELLLAAGWTVLVDATFLLERSRRPLEDLARRLQIPLAIVDCCGALPLARQRIQRRQSRGDDPSDGDLQVLEQQLRENEPLNPEERTWRVEASLPEAAAEAQGVLETLLVTLRLRLGRDPGGSGAAPAARPAPEGGTASA